MFFFSPSNLSSHFLSYSIIRLIFFSSRLFKFEVSNFYFWEFYILNVQFSLGINKRARHSFWGDFPFLMLLFFSFMLVFLHLYSSFFFVNFMLLNNFYICFGFVHGRFVYCDK
jgi:hypothetical protein